MAVEGFSKQACSGRFTDPASTRKKVGVMQPIMLDRIFQRLSDQLLAGNLCKGLRPPFSGYYLI
jgi:hypothetical protein